MQRDMWSTMLILVPIMLEDNMARTSFLVKFELDFKEKRCPICQDLQPSLLCTPPTWSTQHHGDQVHHGGPHVPLLSGLNQNNRLKPQAVTTTIYDSLQPCSSLARLTTTMAGDMDEDLA